MNEEKVKSIIIGVMTFIIIYIIFVLAFHIQLEQDYKTQNFCDYRYGINNWTMVDITGTPQAIKYYGRLHIGQVWECKPNE